MTPTRAALSFIRTCLPLLLVVWAVAGCGSSSSQDTGTQGTVSLSIQVIWPPSTQTTRLRPLTPPAGIVTMEAQVTVGSTTIDRNFTVASNLNGADVTGVPVGSGSVTLIAKDNTGTPVYSGTSTFSGTADQTVGVSITMAPATGQPPYPPQGVTLVPSDATVTVSWTASTGAATYDLHYATSAGVGSGGIGIPGVTSPYIHTPLANGTKYYYTVTAVNSAGLEGGPSAEVSATPLGKPLAPTGVTAAAGNGQVTLNWSGSATATAYNVYRASSTGVTPASGTRIPLANVTTYINSGLTNSTTYYYVVTALNAIGEGAASTEVSATPALPVTGAVAGVTISAGSGQITLNWSAFTGATAYNVYRSTSAGVTKTTNGAIKTALANVTTFTDTGLTNGVNYYYDVTAIVAAAESVDINAVHAAPALANVSNVVPAVSGTQVTLNWTNPITTGFTGVVVMRKTGSTAPTSTTDGTLVTDSTGTSYLDTNLTGGASSYTLFAHDAVAPPNYATGASVTVTVVTPPATPTGLAAAIGNQLATVSWGSVSTATGYNVYYGSTPTLTTSSTKVILSGVNSTSHPFSGLVNGKAYYFAVTATNTGGDSALSPAVCAVPTAGGGASGTYTLYDALCATPLNGLAWQVPQFNRSIAGGQAVLSMQADNMQSRSTQGLNYQNSMTINPNSPATSGIHRVTTIQTGVTVPVATAAQSGGSDVRAVVRLLYQPSADRKAVPGANLNLLVTELALYDVGDGNGLQVRRQIIHCDDAPCVILSSSGITFTDPPGFIQSASTVAALAPAAYDTPYTIGMSFDETTKVFTWKVSGGAYGSGGASGTADVSSWLSSVPAMIMNSNTAGFFVAQVGVRSVNNGADGGSGKITANFSNVTVGIDGAAAAVFDDFSTLGSTAATGFNPSKWNGPDIGADLTGGALKLHADVTTPSTVNYSATATQTLVPPTGATTVFPNSIKADVTITAETPAATTSVQEFIMQGDFYSTAVSNTPNLATGDVRAEIFLTTTTASFQIIAIGQSGGGGSTLTPSTGHPLGLNTTHTLGIQWNPATHTFTFTLDGTTVSVDPTVVGPYISPALPVAQAAPNVLLRQLTAGAFLTGTIIPTVTGSSAAVDVTVNNVFTAP